MLCGIQVVIKIVHALRHAVDGDGGGGCYIVSDYRLVPNFQVLDRPRPRIYSITHRIRDCGYGPRANA